MFLDILFHSNKNKIIIPKRSPGSTILSKSIHRLFLKKILLLRAVKRNGIIEFQKRSVHFDLMGEEWGGHFSVNN